MTATHDLLTWLRAQLDEREAKARDALEQVELRLPGADPSFTGRWHVTTRPTTGSFVATCDQHDRDTEIVPLYGKAYGEHIADNDPAFVLADVEAKRQIIEAHPGGRDHPGDADYCLECGPYWRDGKRTDYPCETLRLLALPFAGRPGWREEWRA